MRVDGLTLADTGLEVFISCAIDSRRDNRRLNPACAVLNASGFEVVQSAGADLLPTRLAVCAAVAPVTAMDERFCGLARRPFDVTPGPRFIRHLTMAPFGRP